MEALLQENHSLLQNLTSIKFGENLVREIVATNEHILTEQPEHIRELAYSFAPLSCFIYICFGVMGSLLITQRKKSGLTVMISEIVALLMILLPMGIPIQSLRYCAGLLWFASAMVVHANAVKREKILSAKEGNVSIDQPHSNDIKQEGVFYRIGNLQHGTLFSPLTEIFFYVRRRHNLFSTGSKVSVKRLLYLLYTMLLVDMSLYLTREWIPSNMSTSNQYTARALVNGVWVLASMDYAYNSWMCVLELLGSPLPYETRHRHPILSGSLAEFWGVRWNPLIGKLLQDSFYIPVRKLGIPRVVCMLSCFAGSAVLHMVPQAMATKSWSDFLMMGSFFAGQGVLVLLERMFLECIGLASYFDKELMPKSAGPYMRAHYQWGTELATVCCALGLSYVYLSGQTDYDFMVWISRFALVAFVGFVYIHMQAARQWHQGDYKAFAVLLLCRTIGGNCWYASYRRHTMYIPYIYHMHTLYR
jgi:hypothetical protein